MKIKLSNIFMLVILLGIISLFIIHMYYAITEIHAKTKITANDQPPYDDFTLLYRVSKYALYNINPFEIASNSIPYSPEIGSLWKFIGSTPWGISLGILINFSFLPESIARPLFITLYFILFILFLIIFTKIIYNKQKKLYSIIIVAIFASFPAWRTAFSWLNYGAILGIFIFGSVLLYQKHPILAGILLGISSIKPQLALPFYLAYLLQKQYKVLTTACIIPLTLWGIASILINISPLHLLGNFLNGNTDKIQTLGTWTQKLGFNISPYFYQTLVSGICIILAFYFWNKLKKSGDTLTYFSIPAVLSGIWTYGQDHDRTVLVILLLCLFNILNNKTEIKNKNLLCYICMFILIIYPPLWGTWFSYLIPNIPWTILIKCTTYCSLILSLFFITYCSCINKN